MVADKESSLRAIVLLAGVAEPPRSALHFQIKNGYDHDTKLSVEERTALIAAIPEKIEAMMSSDPWLKFFLTYDPGATMRPVKTRVLILAGANEQQAVPAQAAAQETVFQEGGNTDVTARFLPDLNHLFVHNLDGFPQGYTKLPAPVVMDQGALDLIADWLSPRLK